MGSNGGATGQLLNRIAFNPAWWGDPKRKIRSNTVGHEVGHLLGQDHIMCKLRSPQCATSPYGTASANALDQLNIMGGGDRIYLINADTWQDRIRQHVVSTPPSVQTWDATGIMATPPRRIALGATLTGLPAF